MRSVLPFFLATLPGALPLHGQLPQAVEAVPEARVLEIRLDPAQPGFGEVFRLHVALRVGPDVIAFLPDTLIPTETAQSAGSGSWRYGPAPGDSVQILATYPVIGFREGLIEFPWMELAFTRPHAASATAGNPPVRALAGRGADGEGRIDTRYLRLGGIDLGAFQPLEAEGLSSSPRPPSDVLGSGWSAWRVLSVLLFSLLGIAAAGILGRAGWMRAASSLGRMPARSPREAALLELERIRSEGWHRNGRMDDFYASTGETLRRFVQSVEPTCGLHLTSTELLEELADRWRSAHPADLSATIAFAERVKFGGHRPGPEQAEEDWAAIRDWIRSLPES